MVKFKLTLSKITGFLGLECEAHDISQVGLINVVLVFLWEPRILTAVKYETTCDTFLTEN